MDRFDYYRLLDRVHRGEADPREIGESGTLRQLLRGQRPLA
jgi:hypothetical protein